MSTEWMRRGRSADVSSVKVVHVERPSPKDGETDLADLAVLHSELRGSDRKDQSSPRQNPHTSFLNLSPATGRQQCTGHVG